MNSTFYYLHALSPLHVGVGQGAGVIDLPIAREKATHLPFIPGSALKGVMREELKDKKDSVEWEALFGSAQNSDGVAAFAGALVFNDAYLLCLPVRSLKGTFAWATCPFILARYVREMKVLNLTALDIQAVSGLDKTAFVTLESDLKINESVVLEDLDLSAKDGANEWAEHIAKLVFPDDPEWQKLFLQRFVILPDSVLDFLAETATEVRARVSVDENTRIVKKGALWYEESLPAETLLYGLVAADNSRKRHHNMEASEMLKKLGFTCRLQIGGNATVGRGIANWIKQPEIQPKQEV